MYMVWIHEGFSILDGVEVLLGLCLRTEIS
jgi:hypothetical protein